MTESTLIYLKRLLNFFRESPLFLLVRFFFRNSCSNRIFKDKLYKNIHAIGSRPFKSLKYYVKKSRFCISFLRMNYHANTVSITNITRRVVVVRDADRMREDQVLGDAQVARGAGRRPVWVLTTARLSRLPATIRSRCSGCGSRR